MSVLTSNNRFAIDALTVFRAAGLTTVGASGGSTGAIGATGVATGYMTLDELTSYWATNDNANLLEFAIVAQVESIGSASGAPSAKFTVRMDSDTAFSSPTPVTEDTGVVLTAAGTTVLTVTREQINDALATLAVGNTTATPVYLDVYFTLGGTTTTPAVAWNAYASPFPA
jgi:hypothetical protein